MVTVTPRCEDCGASHQTVVSFSRGGAGSQGAWETRVSLEPVAYAPIMLGRPGYLCHRHWWRRNLRLQAHARAEAHR